MAAVTARSTALRTAARSRGGSRRSSSRAIGWNLTFHMSPDYNTYVISYVLAWRAGRRLGAGLDRSSALGWRIQGPAEACAQAGRWSSGLLGSSPNVIRSVNAVRPSRIREPLRRKAPDAR